MRVPSNADIEATVSDELWARLEPHDDDGNWPPYRMGDVVSSPEETLVVWHCRWDTEDQDWAMVVQRYRDEEIVGNLFYNWETHDPVRWEHQGTVWTDAMTPPADVAAAERLLADLRREMGLS